MMWRCVVETWLLTEHTHTPLLLVVGIVTIKSIVVVISGEQAALVVL